MKLKIIYSHIARLNSMKFYMDIITITTSQSNSEMKTDRRQSIATNCIRQNDIISSQDIEKIKKYEVKIKTKIKTAEKKIENI